jgi:hypothetical protein
MYLVRCHTIVVSCILAADICSAVSVSVIEYQVFFSAFILSNPVSRVEVRALTFVIDCRDPRIPVDSRTAFSFTNKRFAKKSQQNTETTMLRLLCCSIAQ